MRARRELSAARNDPLTMEARIENLTASRRALARAVETYMTDSQQTSRLALLAAVDEYRGAVESARRELNVRWVVALFHPSWARQVATHEALVAQARLAGYGGA